MFEQANNCVYFKVEKKKKKKDLHKFLRRIVIFFNSYMY